jgi:hypothetical protein
MTREKPEPTWIVMPVLAGFEATVTAIADALAQSVPTRILVVNQGADDRLRDHLERLAEEYPARIFVWSHQPPLPSLAATWNRALTFVWEAGGTEALVVNNDVRLNRATVWGLQTTLERTGALFVSAVGVRPEEFDPQAEVVLTHYFDSQTERETTAAMKGGPDFSCFLISKVCHARFQFDEGFIPAFCEDLDYHRRLMLAGEGARIFSVNLPYSHTGSGTLKTLDEEDPKESERIRRQIEAISRRYYAEKWGGGVNEETFLVPFGGLAGRWTRQDGSAATPYLQARPDEQILTRQGVPAWDAIKWWLGGQGNGRPKSTVLGDPEPETDRVEIQKVALSTRSAEYEELYGQVPDRSEPERRPDPADPVDDDSDVFF